MIALDTNLLIYAHRAATPEHHGAQRAIEEACDDPGGCGIAAASVAEFWAIVTHPAATGRPSTGEEAAGFLSSLVEEAGLQIWSPGIGFGERLSRLAADLEITGVRIFDLQIALTAFENGAREIWTHDGAFTPLPGLRVRDPLAP
jgi:predicted nucleic acid-binding protein